MSNLSSGGGEVEKVEEAPVTKKVEAPKEPEKPAEEEEEMDMGGLFDWSKHI